MILDAGQSHGLGLGIWTRQPQGAGPLASRGFNFIAVGNNELMFYEAALAQLEAGREALSRSQELE
jgi:2-keto-3-deoxy-L-rhamnonate aldolase RhmA